MAKVLVVDDEPAIREMLVSLLTRSDMEVRAAANGHEALEIVRHWPADVVVSDMYMPRMNGTELIKALRTAKPDIQVVAQSGYMTETTHRELKKLGVFAIIEKGTDLRKMVATVKAATAMSTERKPRPDTDHQTSGGAGAGASAKILVAEDHPGFRKLVVDVCTELGYEVDEAGDGAEACDKVADGKYALIFMDLHMPLMGGVKAIGAIRARHPEAFIVAMTGEADAAERAQARRAGAYACLSKPFTVDELKKTVRKMNLIAGQRRRMHAGERERAEREAARPWHHRLRDYVGAHGLPGQRPWAWVVGIIAAGVVCGLLSMSLVHQASVTTKRAAAAYSEVDGYLERVEGYLRRDEQREQNRPGR